MNYSLLEAHHLNSNGWSFKINMWERNNIEPEVIKRKFIEIFQINVHPLFFLYETVDFHCMNQEIVCEVQLVFHIEFSDCELDSMHQWSEIIHFLFNKSTFNRFYTPTTHNEQQQQRKKVSHTLRAFQALKWFK